MDLSHDDFDMVAGALMHAGYRLLSATISNRSELTVRVTGASFSVDGLGKGAGSQKQACGRFTSLSRENIDIPWAELNRGEKFQVIGDILSVLRR